MRVGVLTLPGRNYGCILQATALLGTLRDLGHQPELINFELDGAVRSMSLPRRFKHELWSRTAPLLTGDARTVRTAQFKRDNLCFSPRSFASGRELLEAPPLYDAYVVGSDQVWNQQITGHSPTFFLDFAPDRARKIAYAASFGHDRTTEIDWEAIRPLLARLDAVSVRECAAVEIMRGMIAGQVFHALDPTLLWTAERWSRLAAPETSARPYLLAYVLPGDGAVESTIRDLARRWSRAEGLGVVYLNQRPYRRFVPHEKNDFTAGPAEFLSLLSRASGVVTNSFHGTAFSIVFHRPFLSVYRPPGSGPAVRSGRIVSLLSRVGLESQGVQLGARPGRLQMPEVRWDSVGSLGRLDVLRGASREFLKRALM